LKKGSIPDDKRIYRNIHILSIITGTSHGIATFVGIVLHAICGDINDLTI
jgi:hypothetical protein